MPDQKRLEMIAEVARLYYKEGYSQAEIGQIFDISHSTVSRMIKEAHDEKIVEVIIRYPFKTMPSLAQALKTRFRLKNAFVMPTSGNSYRELINNLAQLGARTLEDTLRDGHTLGISLGMAVAATVRRVKITKPMHVRVVRLQGATENELMEGTDLAQILSGQLGNDSMIIPSPWMMKSQEACHLILQEPSVSEAIRTAENADIGLVGMGSMDPEVSTILRNDLITLEEMQTLREHGAVGEICGKHYDIQGRILDVDFNQRTVSIDINTLSNFSTVIGVAGGVRKAKAMLGAIRGKLINVPVTDSDTARKILDLAETV
jgi:DNA-binding transcriptional regulator LsrR (DeoR family)